MRAHEGLRAAIGEDLCGALRAADGSDYAGALRSAFTALMSRGKDDLRGPLESHRAKVASKADKDAAEDAAKLADNIEKLEMEIESGIARDQDVL